MDDQVCPRCKTTKYRNPSLKLLVNVCGHTLCESCVDLLFLKGSGSCPECNVPLRRNNFRVQLFEDPKVEKEVDIRRRILRDYNKKEEDFANVEDYNDYLEEIENIVFNLVNNVDLLNTNRKIEAYKKENRELIMKNKNRLGREEYELECELEREKAEDVARKQELANIELEAKKRKAKEKEALIDELMASYADAAAIVDGYAKKVEQVEEEAKVVPPVTVKSVSAISEASISQLYVIQNSKQTTFAPSPADRILHRRQVRPAGLPAGAQGGGGPLLRVRGARAGVGRTGGAVG